MSPVRSLAEVLADVLVSEASGDLGVTITGITHDSRRCGPGMLFTAYMGVNQDVHAYLPDAAARGGSACLVERPLAELAALGLLAPGPTYVRVPDVRAARAHAAAALYGHPSRAMTVIGVTGTDGKTTTCTYIEAMLQAHGITTGLVTTVAARVGAREIDTGLHVTTPEPEELQAYLAAMRDAGCTAAVIETTSHGLAQHRVTAVAYDVAAYTNITPEALDYHGSMAAYVAAKAELIRHLDVWPALPGVVKTAVLNADDPSFDVLSAIPVAARLTTSLREPADFRALAVQHDADGLALTAATPAGEVELRSTLLGRHNAANLLTAMAASSVLGCGPEAWRAGAAAVAAIPGRMEPVHAGQAYLALVDFAHTPNGLAHALLTARDLVAPGGRVIAVCGCAGLRDPEKRPAMGRIAVEHAALAIFTAEDPRTEDLGAILAAMADGARAAGAREGAGFILEPDRAAAIRLACSHAAPGDVVIVCGKGHEQSMCFGTTELPWDDRAAVRAALLGQPYGPPAGSGVATARP